MSFFDWFIRPFAEMAAAVVITALFLLVFGVALWWLERKK